jgi:hypothetical protein
MWIELWAVYSHGPRWAPNFTGSKECAAWPGFEPGTLGILYRDCSDWGIRLLIYLLRWKVNNPEAWQTPCYIKIPPLIQQSYRAMLIKLWNTFSHGFHWAPYVTGWEKCATQPGLEPGTLGIQYRGSTGWEHYWTVTCLFTLLFHYWHSLFKNIILVKCTVIYIAEYSVTVWWHNSI